MRLLLLLLLLLNTVLLHRLYNCLDLRLSLAFSRLTHPWPIYIPKLLDDILCANKTVFFLSFLLSFERSRVDGGIEF